MNETEADLRQAGDQAAGAPARDTGAADEQAPARDDQGIPQTGEEDPLAEVSTSGDDADAVAALSDSGNASRQDDSIGDDSIEPSRIPGSAEEIEVGGVTGPGPSG